MALSPFVDIALERDSDGIYDIGLDAENSDAALAASLEPAILASLFSDRRARVDEVADPMQRRGWIGDLVADRPGDSFGSGLWLYGQSRLTPEVAAAIANEARNALQWMIEDDLCTSVTCAVMSDPAQRSVSLVVTIGLIAGGVSAHTYLLASAAGAGLFAL